MIACGESSSRVAKTDSVVMPRDSVVEWARRLDSAADSLRSRPFKFPARSAEGGEGRIYELADSAVRIDVDDFGEMGRVRRRFYARAAIVRLAVRIDERYDQPMSGNVVQTKVDSTWFTGDTAVKWRDTAGVVRVQRDSSFQAHGRDVFDDYLWSTRMAKAAPEPRPF